MTPQEQYENDITFKRRLFVLYHHKTLGETQTAIAKSLGLSTGRVGQIYHRAVRDRNRQLF